MSDPVDRIYYTNWNLEISNIVNDSRSFGIFGFWKNTYLVTYGPLTNISLTYFLTRHGDGRISTFVIEDDTVRFKNVTGAEVARVNEQTMARYV